MSAADSSPGTTAPQTMSEQRIAEIEARLKAATPGPWESIADDDVSRVFMLGASETRSNHETQHVWECDHGISEEDAEHDEALAEQRNEAEATAALIANAPSDIAFLLAELRRAREDRQALIEGRIFMREDIDGDHWIAEGVFEPLTQMPPLICRFATPEEALDALHELRARTLSAGEAANG